MLLLGEILLKQGIISESQLSRALLAQKRQGSRLGEILVSEGTLTYLALYKTLAAHHGLAFADLIQEPPETHLLDNGMPPETFLEYRLLPWRRGADGSIIVAITDYTDAIKHWCREQFGANVQYVITSPFDIRRVIESHFGKTLETSSRLSLWQRFPHSSARLTVHDRQKQLMYGVTLIILALFALAPLRMVLFLIAICQIIYAATMLFKLTVFARGADALPSEHWQQRLSALDERTLPVYTILAPMYQEPESLAGFLQAMDRMDYPKAKMDIKLVLEADDTETLQTAYKLKPHYNFDIIRVPAHAPRTKPKACNYALRFAKGEYITVYDADDRPDPLQLKKTVLTFQSAPKDVACLQARLNYYNANDNLLTRFFSLEYTILFHFLLYGLERLGIPIPLGGTSNHMALRHLKALGEWDPYNVTEDADLGTRLSSRGFKTRMLDSYTMEEAPNRITPWIRQRSRWIKGYMQTWLVHMRDPAGLYQRLGLHGFIGFQFFIGLSCFTFLTAPIVWFFSLLWLESFTRFHQVDFPLWLMWLSGMNLLINFTTHWYLSIYSAFMYRRYRAKIAIAALLYPIYLVLHSVASYRALWQLFVKPHFWEKTMHGLAHHTDGLELEQDMVKSRIAA